jgi:hypothetical protein
MFAVAALALLVTLALAIVRAALGPTVFDRAQAASSSGFTRSARHWGPCQALSHPCLPTRTSRLPPSDYLRRQAQADHLLA